MSVDKTFNGTLILHWKDKKVRVVKKKPRNIGPYEIPIDFTIVVKIPDRTEHKISGTIELPTEKVAEITLEAVTDALEKQKIQKR